MSKEAKPLSELTGSGLVRRLNESYRASHGCTFPAVCVLTAVVVRWCHGHLLSSRVSLIAELSKTSGVVVGKELRDLAGVGWVQLVRNEGPVEYYRPTRAGMLRVIGWAGVRDAQRDAQPEAAE